MLTESQIIKMQVYELEDKIEELKRDCSNEVAALYQERLELIEKSNNITIINNP